MTERKSITGSISTITSLYTGAGVNIGDVIEIGQLPTELVTRIVHGRIITLRRDGVEDHDDESRVYERVYVANPDRNKMILESEKEYARGRREYNYRNRKLKDAGI